MVTTLTFHNGKTFSVKHNTDPRFRSQQEHIDPSRTKDNIIVKNETLKEAYDKLFSESLNNYNQKQIEKGHSERQIDSYLKHVEKSNTHNVAYEIIVQIGDRNTNIDRDTQAHVLTEYVKDFQDRNENLYVFNATVHMDEESPHLHLDYIPVAYNCSRGLEIQNSLEKALNQEGFKTKDKGHTAQMEWTQSERDSLTRLCRSHEIEITHKHENREHLTKENYILLDNNKQLEKNNRELQNDLDTKRDVYNTLDKDIQNLRDEHDGLKKIMQTRYRVPEPDGRGLHKGYHSDKQVMEIVKNLRAEMVRDREEYLKDFNKARGYEQAVARNDRLREDYHREHDRAEEFERILQSQNPKKEYHHYLEEHDLLPEREHIHNRDKDITISGR